ncbi:hypothetical protein CLOP_g2293 [Closterium sp. NIES-67]|nr:hypothetical protein CLOP_g2293 [Closterium sp. NIES-67]
MEEQLGLQQMLAARKEQASAVVRELAREKQALEEALQVQQTNADVIESWLAQNAAPPATTTSTTTTTRLTAITISSSTTTSSSPPLPDIDSAFQPCDALSAQLLKHTAADLAIEDVLYSLDRALQEERGHDEYDPSSANSRRRILTVDAYLRHVRTLAKEQFFQRATALKVQAVQRSARVSQMAERPVSGHALSSAAAAASSAAAAVGLGGGGGGSRGL